MARVDLQCVGLVEIFTSLFDWEGKAVIHLISVHECALVWFREFHLLVRLVSFLCETCSGMLLCSSVPCPGHDETRELEVLLEIHSLCSSGSRLENGMCKLRDIELAISSAMLYHFGGLLASMPGDRLVLCFGDKWQEQVLEPNPAAHKAPLPAVQADTSARLALSDRQKVSLHTANKSFLALPFSSHPPIRHNIQRVQLPHLHLRHIFLRHTPHHLAHLRPPAAVLAVRLKVPADLPEPAEIPEPSELRRVVVVGCEAGESCYLCIGNGAHGPGAVRVEDAERVELRGDWEDEAEGIECVVGKGDAKLREVGAGADQIGNF